MWVTLTEVNYWSVQNWSEISMAFSILSLWSIGFIYWEILILKYIIKCYSVMVFSCVHTCVPSSATLEFRTSVWSILLCGRWMPSNYTSLNWNAVEFSRYTLIRIWLMIDTIIMKSINLQDFWLSLVFLPQINGNH